LPANPTLAGQLGSVLRRAHSIARFVVRLDAEPARKELTIRITALRHEPTQRTDTAGLPLLRRMFAEATKGEWVRFPVDARGLSDESIFATYELIEETAAVTEIAALQQHHAGANVCVSATEKPHFVDKPLPTLLVRPA